MAPWTRLGRREAHRLTSLCPPADVGCDKNCVEKVDEHAADHWNGKVCHRRRAVFLRHDLHIGHRVRGRPHGKADEARGHDRRIVAAPHDVKNHEVGEEEHDDALEHKTDDHRQGEVNQLPEFQACERHSEEDG